MLKLQKAALFDLFLRHLFLAHCSSSYPTCSISGSKFSSMPCPGMPRIVISLSSIFSILVSAAEASRRHLRTSRISFVVISITFSSKSKMSILLRPTRSRPPPGAEAPPRNSADARYCGVRSRGGGADRRALRLPGHRLQPQPDTHHHRRHGRLRRRDMRRGAPGAAQRRGGADLRALHRRQPVGPRLVRRQRLPRGQRGGILQDALRYLPPQSTTSSASAARRPR